MSEGKELCLKLVFQIWRCSHLKPLLSEEDPPAIGRLLVDTERMRCQSSSRLGKKKSKIENIMLGTRTSPMPGKHHVIIHNLWKEKSQTT